MGGNIDSYRSSRITQIPPPVKQKHIIDSDSQDTNYEDKKTRMVKLDFKIKRSKLVMKGDITSQLIGFVPVRSFSFLFPVLFVSNCL